MNSEKIISFLFIIVFGFQEIRGNEESVQNTILKNVLKSYDKNLYPYLDRPTEDRIGMYINSFSINNLDMSYKITFYMRQSWKDPRLNFEDSTVDSWDDISEDIKTKLERTKKIRVSPETVKQLFMPDLLFRNGHNVDVLPLDKVSHENTLLTINKTGHVWFIRKLTATFACPMQFQRFPFDTQSCPIIFESFGATMDSLYFNWLASPVDVDPGIQQPEFTLKDIVLFDCSQNYTAAAFPCLEVRFILHRDGGYYIFQGFIPSGLAVCMSWFMLWTDMESGFKVMLGLILMALLVTLNNFLTRGIPTVSYLKCVDIWFNACILLVLLTTIIAVRIGKTQEHDGGKRFGGRKLEKVAKYAFPVIFVVLTVIFIILYSVV